MGSIFKLTALAGVAAGAYAVVKKFAPNILPDKNEAADMAKNAINSVKLTFPTDEKYSRHGSDPADGLVELEHFQKQN